jgi:hypothetical protein
MAKIDLDSLGIDELVKLRETVNAKLQEKVASRQLELEAELQRLSEFGKSAKKAAPPASRAKKGEDRAEEKRGEDVQDHAQQQEPPAAEAA